MNRAPSTGSGCPKEQTLLIGLARAMPVEYERFDLTTAAGEAAARSPKPRAAAGGGQAATVQELESIQVCDKLSSWKLSR